MNWLGPEETRRASGIIYAAQALSIRFHVSPTVGAALFELSRANGPIPLEKLRSLTGGSTVVAVRTMVCNLRAALPAGSVITRRGRVTATDSVKALVRDALLEISAEIASLAPPATAILKAA